MAVDFKTFLKVVPLVVANKKPVMLRGRHGIGKSQVVYQFADSLGRKVVERRASQMTEGDLIGMPSIEGNTTRFNPPDWFKECCDEPRVLFLDEVDRAILEVRQGIFELTDSRKLNGHVLHPDTLVFAAVNGGLHGAQYQVGEMDPAELDRWFVLDVEPSVEDWLDFAKDKVDGIVWDFVNQNRGHLEHKGEFEPHKVYPSRRSWMRFSDDLNTAKLLAGEDYKAQLPMVYEIGHGYLGFEAAVAFRDFVSKYERQVTIEDILKGRLDKVEKWTINDHTAMTGKMIQSGMFKDELSDSDMEAIVKYMRLVPSEVLMKFWSSVSVENIKNTIKMHKGIKDRIVEILNPSEASKDTKDTKGAKAKGKKKAK